MLYDLEQQYLLAFRQGAIGREEAMKYIKLLKKETLNRITHTSFEHRLIKPVLKMALEKLGEEPEETCLEEFDSAVNDILENKKTMFILMTRYCI